jgi:hypothetical protein
VNRWLLAQTGAPRIRDLAGQALFNGQQERMADDARLTEGEDADWNGRGNDAGNNNATKRPLMKGAV